MAKPALPEVRTFATNVTAFSIMLVGFAFLAAMFFLLLRGTTGSILLALLFGIVGLAVLTGGFLFVLVPSKVDEIQAPDEKGEP